MDCAVSHWKEQVHYMQAVFVVLIKRKLDEGFGAPSRAVRILLLLLHCFFARKNNMLALIALSQPPPCPALPPPAARTPAWLNAAGL